MNTVNTLGSFQVLLCRGDNLNTILSAKPLTARKRNGLDWRAALLCLMIRLAADGANFTTMELLFTM